MNLSSTKASLKFDAHAEVRERPFDFHGGGGVKIQDQPLQFKNSG